MLWYLVHLCRTTCIIHFTVCSIDYLITNAGPYAWYSGFWTWLYFILLCGTILILLQIYEQCINRYVLNSMWDHTHGYMTIICCIILHICNAFAFSTILLLQSNGYFCNVDDVEPYAGNSDYWSMIPYVFNMSIIS